MLAEKFATDTLSTWKLQPTGEW